MKALRSIGLDLTEVINGEESTIVKKLRQCSKLSTKYYFKVILFHQNITSDEIKTFVTKYTDELFNINVEITKQWNKRVFYAIEPIGSSSILSNYRYKYIGNILFGLEEYIKLMTHVAKREQEKIQ